MPAIKNKHLLWAASLGSLGAAVLGAAAVVGGPPQPDPEAGRLHTELSRANQSLQDLKDETGRSLDDLKREIALLRDASRRDRAAFDEVTARARKTEDELRTVRAALGDRGGDLKALSEALAPLVRKPWRDDLETLAGRIDGVEKRLNEPRPSPKSEADDKPRDDQAAGGKPDEKPREAESGGGKPEEKTKEADTKDAEDGPT